MSRIEECLNYAQENGISIAESAKSLDLDAEDLMKLTTLMTDVSRKADRQRLGPNDFELLEEKIEDLREEIVRALNESKDSLVMVTAALETLGRMMAQIMAKLTGVSTEKPNLSLVTKRSGHIPGTSGHIPGTGMDSAS
jgi:hypothetical protein